MAHLISSVAETRDGALSSFLEVDLMKWFPVAFLTNGIFVVICVGCELATHVLLVSTLTNYAMSPPRTWVLRTLISYAHGAMSRSVLSV